MAFTQDLTYDTKYNADNLNCTNPNFAENTKNDPYVDALNQFMQFITGTVSWREKKSEI